jgi:hypothetical protein
VETITRACGHAAEFSPRGDGYEAARREKIAGKRCPACGREKNRLDNLAQQQADGSRVKKGQETKCLPDGAEVRLTLAAGVWHGTLTAGEVSVEVETAGAMGVLSKLARRWLQQSGRKIQGKA